MSEQELKLLKEKIQLKKVIIGSERILKGLKKGTMKKIFLASNCPAELKKDLLYYASLSGSSVVLLALNGEELGVFCKKNFLISVVGLTEE